MNEVMDCVGWAILAQTPGETGVSESVQVELIDELQEGRLGVTEIQASADDGIALPGNVATT